MYLASTSPRRSQLLGSAGVDYRPVEPGPEVAGDGPPVDLAQQRAASKARGTHGPSRTRTCSSTRTRRTAARRRRRSASSGCRTTCARSAPSCSWLTATAPRWRGHLTRPARSRTRRGGPSTITSGRRSSAHSGPQFKHRSAVVTKSVFTMRSETTETPFIFVANLPVFVSRMPEDTYSIMRKKFLRTET